MPFDQYIREENRILAAYAKRQEDENRYSLFLPGNLFAMQQRERQVLALLQRHGFGSLRSKKILEIGCGTGYWLREFIKWGANPENIEGIDIRRDCIDQAVRLSPLGVKLACANAIELELRPTSFDLILQSTVLTSVLDDATKRRVATEMLRLLKADGLILWYDFHFDNPRNADVRGVKKEEICRLFPGCMIELHRVTLAPPIQRFLAPYSWLACLLLERIPFLCTHYLGVIRRS